jgi:Domain of unknown function (DUF3291)
MTVLAYTTFAIMKAPYGSPEVYGFESLTPDVFLEAEAADGFISRAREIDNQTHLTNFERDWGDWGSFTVPSFYDGGFETASDTRASTISLWTSIEAVRNFAYNSCLHSQALKQRGQWFRTTEWPTYAMWWVPQSHIPTWSEASQKLDFLHKNGPTKDAFTFKRLFDQSGQEIKIEKTTTTFIESQNYPVSIKDGST